MKANHQILILLFICLALSFCLGYFSGLMYLTKLDTTEMFCESTYYNFITAKVCCPLNSKQSCELRYKVSDLEKSIMPNMNKFNISEVK